MKVHQESHQKWRNKVKKNLRKLSTVALASIAIMGNAVPAFAEDSKTTEFTETVESGYEWSIPATVSVASGASADLTITVSKNIIPAGKKLVISTASNKITLTSDEGATVAVTLDSTSYEAGTGVTGSKTIKATSAVATAAGTYKGVAKFTASVQSAN